MFTFDQAYDACEKAGHFPSFQREMMQGTPLYIHEFNDTEIKMPTPKQWQEFKYCDEFQRVFPSPITRTIQSCDSLNGFKVYSVLMSDGSLVAAHKMFTKDKMLLLMVQMFNIDDVIKELQRSPQALNVNHRCFSVLPVPNNLSDQKDVMNGVALPLLVTTFHFIYSVHVDRQRYKKQ